jgi:hypothetical protein
MIQGPVRVSAWGIAGAYLFLFFWPAAPLAETVQSPRGGETTAEALKAQRKR